MAVPTVTLLSAVAATGAGSVSQVSRHATVNPTNAGVVQAVISGVASVDLQGSLDNVNWVTICSFSSSGLQSFAQVPFIRGNVTAFTSGTVTLIACV